MTGINSKTIFLAVIVFLLIAAAIAPAIYDPGKSDAVNKMSLESCRLNNGHLDLLSKDGGPSKCFTGLILKIQGTMTAAIMVDSVWGMSQASFDQTKVDSDWRSFSKISVLNSEHVEWPIYVYQFVPILRDIYSPHGAIDCINNLKVGIRCYI